MNYYVPSPFLVPLAIAGSCIALLALSAMGIWQTLGLLAVSLLVNEYLGPKPRTEDARPTGLDDVDTTSIESSRKVLVFWGRVRINSPTAVYINDWRQDAIERTIRSGLWSKKEYIAGYRNHLGWQQTIGYGGGSNIAYRGVYVGDEKVWEGTVNTNSSISIDENDLFGGDDAAGGFQATIDFFVGSSTQPVSSYLSTVDRLSVTEAATQTAPAYRDVGYMVIREFGIQPEFARGAYVGTTNTIKSVGVEAERFADLIPGQTAGTEKIGLNNEDCNPVNALYEVYTNTIWGLGRDPNTFDHAVWAAAAEQIHSEENGFAFVLTDEIDAGELVEEIERQIDGVVSRDLRTGKWILVLARDDYDILTVPQLDDSNMTVLNYTRSTYEDTTNEVQLEFANRLNDYNQDIALAQDHGNAQIQGGGDVQDVLLVSARVKFPGVKDNENAARLAWREVRTLAYPIARTQVETHREFWDVNLNSVVAFRSAKRGITERVPMRVQQIDLGTEEDQKIVIDLVEDTSFLIDPSYGAPAPSLSPPITEILLNGIPADEQVVMEAPRGIYIRDPIFGLLASSVPTLFRGNAHLFVSAARQTAEIGFYTRGSFNPTFLYNSVQRFMQFGLLSNPLPQVQSNPVASIDIAASQATFNEFGDVTPEVLGTELIHLILIDNEFMLCERATFSAGVLTLVNVYRGALDTPQEAHAASTKVKLLFTGSALAAAEAGFNLPAPIGLGGPADPTDWELVPHTVDEIYDGSNSIPITPVTVDIQEREIRPYLPGAVVYNGSTTGYNTPSFEGAGSGLNGFRIDIDWWRRAFETLDEVAELLSDNTAVDPSTEYRVTVTHDPSGSPTQMSQSAWIASNGTVQIDRLAYLELGPAGTELRVEIRSRHDVPGNSTQITFGTAFGPVNDVESLYDLTHDFTPTSSLDGQHYFGNVSPSTWGTAYEALATGNYTINLGASHSTTVFYRINGGAAVAIVGATATFAVTAGDDIEVGNHASGTPNPNFVELQDPGSVSVAYGVLT